MEFIPYKKQDIKKGRFYRVPKEFVENETYRKGLNSNAKLVYSMLRDRYELSIKNNWVDQDGNVYCYYSRENLAEDLGVGVRTIDAAIKQLGELKLLHESLKNGKAKRYYIGVPTPAEIAQVDGQPLQNLHPNETEFKSFKETEEKNIHLITDNEDYVFYYYSKKYKEKFNREHPTMTKEKLEELYNNYVFLDLEKFPRGNTADFWEEIIDHHFENLSPKNDGNILAFLSLNGGYGPVGRYIEDLYY